MHMTLSSDMEPSEANTLAHSKLVKHKVIFEDNMDHRPIMNQPNKSLCCVKGGKLSSTLIFQCN